ncbi:uncharacterized protein BO97DRAFT_403237 [Aspergillus homomorphus CBS 101889]|uniref:Uncharacterized protein n=1 Tax=Aspergillus homomorphus (strain CBS 101889) TaxID=1450537 RepID=A0A395I8G4_ASPHC|nr:hypothetical protein BO97DRAFT_403237 [Aspergillus homomorphus CBS 101889]RAL16079.1 hypothetical protein BO97DRAFT_403237 [Aspergillus homomorphus CBS 101889]
MGILQLLFAGMILRGTELNWMPVPAQQPVDLLVLRFFDPSLDLKLHLLPLPLLRRGKVAAPTAEILLFSLIYHQALNPTSPWTQRERRALTWARRSPIFLREGAGSDIDPI